ncbi:unnamed protein product [Spirodela intermedia]|uniref:Telomerase reverse transcriptase n=1 Tax=Spirodela intermedia TaxID=51605 RepID=A0A7I8JZC4_SPIIN|nr:unnamed protein product [Spirodela intermedia]
MARKRHRIPEVLRRTFGDRARTLGETILSLSPKPPPKQVECLCRGRGCVRCGGSSFLLRQEDGPDYRQLLNRCFCVVSPGAPELTDLCYRGEWTQRLIVRYTVESLIGRSHSYDNVLREGYDEIGESAMTFLLKYSSIFIPLPTNNHHQVTGPLLNKVLQSLNLSHKPVIPILPSKDLQTLTTGDHIDNGCESKRKKRKFEAKQKIFPPFNHHGESVEVQNKYYDVYGKPQKYVGPFYWKQYKKIRCMKVMEGSIVKDPLDMNTNEGESNTPLQRKCSMCLSFHSHSLDCRDMSDIITQKPALDSHKSVLMPRVQIAKGDMKMESDSSTAAHLGPVISQCFQTNSEYFASPGVGICSTSEVFAKSRKRKRLYSWQRHTRCKKRNTLDRSNSRSSIINDKESSSSFLQWEPDLHRELPEQMTKINYPIIKKKYKETNQYSTDIAIPNLLEDGVIHCETFNREQNVKHLNTNVMLLLTQWEQFMFYVISWTSYFSLVEKFMLC